MRIALAQIVSGREPERNLDLVARGVGEAAAEGADLVVFPEATMRAFGHHLSSIAEPVDGPWASAVRALAQQHGVTVVVGMFTPGVGERVRNSLLVTGPGVEAAYDKIHLFDAFGFAESDTVTPGEHPVLVEVAGLTVGLATCYDVRFPALFIDLALAGAQVVVLAASWGAGPDKVDQWELLVRARALDSTAYVVACGQADPEAAGVEAVAGAPTGVGHSMVVDPLGRVVVRLGDHPKMIMVDVDPADVAAARRTLPVLANRRTWPPP